MEMGLNFKMMIIAPEQMSPKSILLHTWQMVPNLKVAQMHLQCLNMQFNLRMLPIYCQIQVLTIDMLAPQIFRAYLEFAQDMNPYCPPELQIYTPDIF